ncbi:MAG: hypothetical protein R3272_06990, partial [Candidatus Promineifilaceae bacterium]|nr:hypothetical protein [Candidatus Promineifilaceae bacterium]
MDRRSQNSEVGVQSSAHALVSALGLRTASPEREQEVDANGSEGAVAGLIEGKGYFIWRVEQVLARPGMGTPREAARQARDAGIEHVIVKVADGDDAYPLQSRDADGHKEEATVELIAALRREGIRVWGWAVAYGEGPEPERQAAVFAGRARQLSLTGLVVNAENHGERIWFRQRGEEQARRYMRKLREELAEVEGLIIGFSSYRYIEYQPSFPFAAFMEEADIAMPRIFWVSRGEGDAIADLRRSYREYKEAFPRKLYIPVGAAYGG